MAQTGTVYGYQCGDCFKDVTTNLVIQCAKCQKPLCKKCGEIYYCANCQATLPPNIVSGLFKLRNFMKVSAIGLVLAGIVFIIVDILGLTPDFSSLAIGLALMVFAIPYYFLLVLVVFPNKAKKAHYSPQTLKKASQIPQYQNGVDMSRNPLETLFKCPKCHKETSSIGVKTGDDGKYYVVCQCGETVNWDHTVFRCGKCGKYYPDGTYRCPKCKWDGW